ncbi:MAG TPA: nucleotidyltransferase domain-containing protein, partial [Gaiellaceae bacterium]|nr:nucleotidyltransferase domain-containing protein [Gaiellaceae bacterium]
MTGRPSGLAPLGAAYGALYDRLAVVLAAHPAVRSFEPGGSLARGDADRWSDLDLVVHVTDLAAFDAAGAVRAAADTVLLRTLPFGVTALTSQGLRIDLVVREGDEVADPTSRPTAPTGGLCEE